MEKYLKLELIESENFFSFFWGEEKFCEFSKDNVDKRKAHEMFSLLRNLYDASGHVGMYLNGFNNYEDAQLYFNFADSVMQRAISDGISSKAKYDRT